jgi:hypothetical protein
MKTILRYPLIRLLLGLLLVAGPYFLLLILFLGPFLNQFSGQPIRFLVRPVTYLTVTALIVVLYWLFVTKLEQRPFRELAPDKAGLLVRNGVLLTLLFTAVVFIPLGLSGHLLITAINGWQYVPQGLALAFMAATVEEILFRGLLFRLTEESLGSLMAVGISSLLFGIAHYLNPGATVWSALGIGLSAGMALSAIYMLTRTLWTNIAAHATWNAFNDFMGVPDTGGAQKGYFTTDLVGDEILTGGRFGIESSVLTLIVGILIGGVLLWLAYRRNSMKPPFWIT